jgi:hypothetical protein
MQRFDPVGRCIYCGARSELTDEHIIPLGLNGDWILPKASCSACATVTSKFEMAVLRGPLLQARLGLGLRSRRRKQQPTSLPFLVTRDGIQRDEHLPVAQGLNSVLLPIFAEPGFFRSDCPEGISVTGWYHAHYNRTPQTVLTDLDAERIGVEVRYPVVEFAQMLAKIAYAYAVAVAGAEAVHSPWPLAAIMGSRNDIGCWVGTSNDAAPAPEPNSLHTVGLVREGEMMAVPISLFTMQDAPIYVVLLQGGNFEPTTQSHPYREPA